MKWTMLYGGEGMGTLSGFCLSMDLFLGNLVTLGGALQECGRHPLGVGNGHYNLWGGGGGGGGGGGDV